MSKNTSVPQKTSMWDERIWHTVQSMWDKNPTISNINPHFIIHWRHQGKHGEKTYFRLEWCKVWARTVDEYLIINLDTQETVEQTTGFVR